MRPADGLATHCRLAALLTTALAFGLTARHRIAETGGVCLRNVRQITTPQITANLAYSTDLCPVKERFSCPIELYVALLHPPQEPKDTLLGNVFSGLEVLRELEYSRKGSFNA